MHFRLLVIAVTIMLALAGRSAVCVAAEQGAADAHKAAGHDEHAHIGANDVSKDPADFKTDLALWTLVVFGVLLLVLRKFAWAPIMSGLEKRERTVAEHIAMAEQSEEQAKRLLAEYEAKLRSAEDEVRLILEDARKHAEQVQQQILAQARGDAKAETERAKAEIETAKDQALIALSQSAADHAVALAGKILGARITAADHRSLIESALAGFAQENAQRN